MVRRVVLRSTRARSASRRRLRPDVRAGSGSDEEKRVAVGLALVFASLAAIDVLIVTFVDEFRLPAVLLLVYLLSLIAALLFALWRKSARA
jgi:hypothetical protein